MDSRKKRQTPGFQSTLPRRERRYVDSQNTDKHEISIHAPAKGATSKDDGRHSEGEEFQSTLPRRERQYTFVGLGPCFSISIHAPAKGATKDGPSKMYLPKISIHAPAKGATVIKPSKVAWKEDFNPRSREGSDNSQKGPKPYTIKFQSTLPRRERLIDPIYTLLDGDISIHAPAKGATIHTGQNSQEKKISIHAPAKGATSKSFSTLPIIHFNPRSREGSDLMSGFTEYTKRNFNPRSREGSDWMYVVITQRTT